MLYLWYILTLMSQIQYLMQASAQTFITDTVVGGLNDLRYPIIFGGYDDKHVLEGFAYDFNQDLVLSARTCSPTLTDPSTTKIRWYIAYLENFADEINWAFQLPSTPFEVDGGTSCSTSDIMLQEISHRDFDS